MSYLVLARKYRPQAFADMTGQEHVVRTLANAIAQDRVAHAYLFCGPRGVGKTTAARLLAKALNCASGPTSEPCGKCAPCTEIAAGTSMDVAEIDGASNNGVENVREIREAARYLPNRDRNKIYIIDEVHMLSGAAFNALLKTLEEPPPHVKFIFATTEPHKLPDTILSRCQRHNFRRIPTAMMLQRLREILAAEQAQVSDTSLALVARQSEGGMRDALSLLDQILSACGSAPSDEAVSEAIGAIDRTQVHELARALLVRDAKKALAAVDEVFIRGVDLKRLAEELALYLRHVMVAKVTKEAPEELAESEKKAVLELAHPADAAQIARLFDLAHAAVREISVAAQPRLALEVALLKGIHLAPGAAVEDLVGRLETLAKGGTLAPRPGPTFPVAAAAAPEPKPAMGLQLDASPGGCATGECLPELRAELAAAAPPPARTEDDPTQPISERWKAALESVKKVNPRLADSLSHSRPLWIRPGELAVAFVGERAEFHQKQASGPGRKDELERALLAHFGRATALKIEKDAPADDATPASPAEELALHRADRETRLKNAAREHPAVRAAMGLFGGTLQEIRVREEISAPALQGDEDPFDDA